MSAYLVNEDTLDLLASVANWSRDGLWLYRGENTLPPRSELETGESGIYYKLDHAPLIKHELFLENVASLRARYGDDDPNPVKPAKFRRIDRDQVTIGEALGALACYEYQACESENWANSYAFALCNSIRKTLCRMVSGDNWEFTRPASYTERVSLMDLMKEAN